MKTTQNDGDVGAFLAGLENRRRAQQAETIAAMMERITGDPPRMWGDSIIGFGSYAYRRKDGSPHQFFLTGVSPRKQALTIYIMPGFSAYGDQLARLGKAKHSSSCLYVTRLENIDLDVLEEIVTDSVSVMRARYPKA